MKVYLLHFFVKHLLYLFYVFRHIYLVFFHNLSSKFVLLHNTECMGKTRWRMNRKETVVWKVQLFEIYLLSFVLQIWNNVGSRVDMKSQETLRNLKTCIQEVLKNIGGSLQRYYSCNYNICISQTSLCITLQWL